MRLALRPGLQGRRALSSSSSSDTPPDQELADDRVRKRRRHQPLVHIAGEDAADAVPALITGLHDQRARHPPSVRQALGKFGSEGG